MKRRLARLIKGSGRLVRPPVVAVAGVMLAIAGLAALGFVTHRWATGVEDRPTTLAGTAVLLDNPIRLDAAREVAWRYALMNARDQGDAWRDLLEPPVPPALCALVGATAPANADAGPEPALPVRPDDAAMRALDDAVRSLDQLLMRGARAGEIEQALDVIRAGGPFAARGRAEFVARYNLARGYLSAGDAAAAAELIEPVFAGYLSERRIPITGASAAADLVARGDVSARLAIDAFHGRFLAATIAYGRSDTSNAIINFRFAINAVNYLAATDAGLDAPASYERVSIAPGGACTAGRSDQVLSSLDAYAGLVASYMVASEFRDPTRLGPEVRRTRFEIDANDPFQPVLRYARSIASGDRRNAPTDEAAVPENLIWAASNLQRVYHYNRIEPDPRLEVTRAALLLHLTDDRAWLEALDAGGDATVCEMLGAVAAQLVAGGAVRAVGRSTAADVDSARAAAGLLTYARLGDSCHEAPAVPPDVQSAWLLEGIAAQIDPLAARFEDRRGDLERAVRTSADERVLHARAAEVLNAVDADARRFRSGRLPPDVPVTVSTVSASALADAWQRAVFEDVAFALTAMLTADGRTAAADVAPVSAGILQVPAGRADRFLSLLDAAIIHAGRRPADFYGAADLASMARAGGLSGYIAYRIRYAARNEPAAAAASIGAAFLLTTFALLVLHLNFWRFTLVARGRTYAAEAERRGTWPSS